VRSHPLRASTSAAARGVRARDKLPGVALNMDDFGPRESWDEPGISGPRLKFHRAVEHLRMLHSEEAQLHVDRVWVKPRVLQTETDEFGTTGE
jgi:hypothetical protein